MLGTSHSDLAIVSRGGKRFPAAAACCGALMLILMASGFITECAGLSHTRHTDLGACPSDYWGGSAGLLSLRAILWAFLACMALLCWYDGMAAFTA